MVQRVGMVVRVVRRGRDAFGCGGACGRAGPGVVGGLVRPARPLVHPLALGGEYLLQGWLVCRGSAALFVGRVIVVW